MDETREPPKIPRKPHGNIFQFMVYPRKPHGNIFAFHSEKTNVSQTREHPAKIYFLFNLKNERVTAPQNSAPPPTKYLFEKMNLSQTRETHEKMFFFSF